MKGLSLTQPWATLVAIGAKRIETRGWSTSYRGELLIASAKKFPRDCQGLCFEPPFLYPLIFAGFDRVDGLSLGCIVAVAELVDVFSTNVIDATKRTPEALYELEHEREFGDYSMDRFGFVLANVRKLSTPVPAAHVDRDGTVKPGGALGLWSVPQVVLDLVAGQGGLL